ncbi:hypothetical protein GCM10023149_48620 [Mucilaginibacter gynuensis]|uniref:Uncharacterized protein n=1 Tax=Mucilaginibacter gynuensis TaxID=1302236 RepID=A0ABP8HF84_9SPHI
MKTKRHMAVNIQGLLNAYKGKKIDVMTDDDGNFVSDQKARIHLHNLQIQGHKYMPCAKCEGFDPFEHGCPGHVIEE